MESTGKLLIYLNRNTERIAKKDLFCCPKGSLQELEVGPCSRLYLLVSLKEGYQASQPGLNYYVFWLYVMRTLTFPQLQLYTSMASLDSFFVCFHGGYQSYLAKRILWRSRSVFTKSWIKASGFVEAG